MMLHDVQRAIGWSRIRLDFLAVSRRAARAPFFLIFAVVLLGTGLGVGTAFFNLVNAAFLKTCGGDSLVRFRYVGSDNWSILLEDDIARVIQNPPDSLAWVGGHNSVRTAAIIRGASRPVRVESILGPHFQAIGGSALMGRLLDPRDDTPDREAAAVISEPFWRAAFAGDPSAIGTSFVVAGKHVTVVGIAHSSLSGLGGGIIAMDV